MSESQSTTIRIHRDTLDRLQRLKDGETHDELVNRLLDNSEQSD